MGNLAHLATRIFGVPLLIERNKLDVILSVVAPRLGIDAEFSIDKVYGPGDTGKTRKSYYVTEDKIGVISIIGPLVKRTSGEFLSGGPTTYGEVEQEFMDAATDPAIEGVLLVVDSPGGESVGAFELSDMIYSQRGGKPIYAVADGDAFSAAFALASAADRLYVTKSGGVGSVGVWMMHVDQSGFNKQKGLKPTYLFAGARKIDGNPHEPLSDKARETFQAEVDRIYEMFVSTVARNAGMSPKAVRQTEAGLYFGQDAVAIGFADAVGTFSDALADLRAAIARPSSNAGARSASANSEKEVDDMPPNEVPKADAGTQAAPTPEQPTAPNIEALVEEAKQAGLAEAGIIADLCAIAGCPARVAAFIQEKKTANDVRKILVDERAARDEESTTLSAVMPGADAETANPKPAKSMTEVMKQVVSEMAANPKGGK